MSHAIGEHVRPVKEFAHNFTLVASQCGLSSQCWGRLASLLGAFRQRERKSLTKRRVDEAKVSRKIHNLVCGCEENKCGRSQRQRSEAKCQSTADGYLQERMDE